MVATNEGKRKSLELSCGGSSSDGAGGSASSPMPSGVLVIGEDSQMARRERNRKKRERMKKRKMMDPKFWSKNMDPNVWGNLPRNLVVEIYKRLPIRRYYRLREVCRDWNLAARERRCVTDPIHKPYFVLIHDGEYERFFGGQETDDEDVVDEVIDDRDDYSGVECKLHGMLTFHIESGGWRWKKLHAILPVDKKLLHKPFSVKGLTFSRVYPKRSRSYRVFDAHTRLSYRIPLQPKLSKMSRALGMTVDISVVPHSFKIIVGSLDIGTQIYDSVTKSWETRASLLVPCVELKFKSCVHCGDCLYIWTQDDKILVYSLEKDKWSTLNPPSTESSKYPQVPSYHAGLGSWDGRIFAVTSTTLDDPTFRVWELDDQHEQKHWKFVDEMPSDVQRLVTYDLSWYHVVSSFCDELVMIHFWVAEKKRSGQFVLYNLASKKWEKVVTPGLSVSVHSNIDSELSDYLWEEMDDLDEVDESDDEEWVEWGYRIV